MIDKGISSRVVREGDNLLISFPIETAGRDYATSRTYFFKVSAVQLFFRKYNQLPAIASGSGVAYNYLGDGGLGSGSDVLRIQNDDFLVHHVGFGVPTPYLRLYKKIDPSPPNSSLDYINTDQPEPTAGDNFDYVPGQFCTDAFDPPAATEMLSFRNDKKGGLIKLGFYNEGPDDIPAGRPLNIVGHSYKLWPITDRRKQNEMLEEVLRPSDKQMVRSRVIQIAGLRNYRLGTTLPSEWQREKNYKIMEF